MSPPPSPRPVRVPSFSRAAGRWRALALAAAGVWTAASAHGDIQQPPKASRPGEKEVRRQEPPATALPGRASVALGDRVEIVLAAVGGESRAIEFILREPPAHGILIGTPRPITRTTAAITYAHRAADGPAADEFTFAVQARGSGVSVAAPVAIAVADAAPELAATPGELDFGAVKTGSTSRAELTVENRGGGMAVGRLAPPAPWVVADPADYRLSRGQRQTFAVVFRPDRDDVFAETWRFAGDEGRHSVRLIGTGLGGAPPARPPVAAVVMAENSPTPPPVVIPDTRGPLPSPASPAAGATPTPAPTPAPVAAVADSPPAYAPPAKDSPVTRMEGRGTSASTIELSWSSPTPAPRSYRVEMRYLRFPAQWKERMETGEIVAPDIEWRVYEPTQVSVKGNAVTARLSGLQEVTIYALRVVAVDGAGQAANPSPEIFVETRLAEARWKITPLKVLLVLLVGCGAVYAYRRWQERQAFG